MFKGIGHNLTQDELNILAAFKDSNEIAFPVGCGLTYKETVDILVELTQKDIIKGRGPYQLTKLGKRILNKC